MSEIGQERAVIVNQVSVLVSVPKQMKMQVGLEARRLSSWRDYVSGQDDWMLVHDQLSLWRSEVSDVPK